jgi:hypothetical protein
MAIVNTLPAYVEQNHDSLLRSAVLGAESAQMFTLQTGVKTKTALNLLNTSVVFQDGSGCGFNAQGESKVSQRTISAPIVKVNMNFCDKDLLNSAMQHDVRVAAGQKTLPFEEDFVGDVVNQVNIATEMMVWQGDTDSEDNVLKWTDGILKHLNASDGITKAENKLTHSTDIVKAVDDVILAIPTAVLKNATIWMGYDYYRAYIVAMKSANLYHYDANGVDKGETFYPGSNIKIKAVAGLDGTNTIVAGDARNFFYGTDMQGDAEKFDFWYSKDNQEFRLAIEFGLGTQVAFPNEVIISTKA